MQKRTKFSNDHNIRAATKNLIYEFFDYILNFFIFFKCWLSLFLKIGKALTILSKIVNFSPLVHFRPLVPSFSQFQSLVDFRPLVNSDL